MTTSVDQKISGAPPISPIVKGASGVSQTSTTTATGDGDSFATITFAANELQAGDVIKVRCLYEGTFASANVIARCWIGGIASGNRFYSTTISSGGTDTVGLTTYIFINSTTNAKSMRDSVVSGVGTTGAVGASITIDTTSAVTVDLGHALGADGSISLHGYVVEHVKAL